MIYKYQADIETYINGKPIEFGTGGWYKHKKGDVCSYRVSMKVDGNFVGLSDPFKTKLQAWKYLEQFEEKGTI